MCIEVILKFVKGESKNQKTMNSPPLEVIRIRNLWLKVKEPEQFEIITEELERDQIEKIEEKLR